MDQTRREMLGDIFRDQILGSSNVYFQPPESVKMHYPAIVYSLDDIANTYADDRPYLSARRYKVTIIDRNPDSILPGLMNALPFCDFDRAYATDGLNHWVFSLYF